MTQTATPYPEQLKLLADQVRKLVKGYTTGLLVLGNTGTSKSWTIKDTLDAIPVPFEYRNTVQFAQGMYMDLHDHPNAIFVYDDCDGLLTQKRCLSTLKAATHGPIVGK